MQSLPPDTPPPAPAPDRSPGHEVDYGDEEVETPEQRRSRRAAVIWLVCFVGGIYLLATALGLWLWLSGRLSL